MTASVHALRPHIPAALVASQVGTWEFDVVRERCYFDAVASILFGYPAQDGARGVPLALLRPKIDATDQEVHRRQGRIVRRDGSIFVHEMHLFLAPNIERWLLTRGRFEADASGKVVYARGIAIDITESRQKGFVEGRVSFVDDPDDAGLTALDRAADAALLAYEAIAAMGPTARPSLARIMELLLHELGREIAAKQA